MLVKLDYVNGCIPYRGVIPDKDISNTTPGQYTSDGTDKGLPVPEPGVLDVYSISDTPMYIYRTLDTVWIYSAPHNKWDYMAPGYDTAENISRIAKIANDNYISIIDLDTRMKVVEQDLVSSVYRITPESLPADKDLNTVTTIGMYYQIGSINGLNYPVASPGTLEVKLGNQQEYKTNAGRIFFRVLLEGEPSTWVETTPVIVLHSYANGEERKFNITRDTKGVILTVLCHFNPASFDSGTVIANYPGSITTPNGTKTDFNINCSMLTIGWHAGAQACVCIRIKDFGELPIGSVISIQRGSISSKDIVGLDDFLVNIL